MVVTVVPCTWSEGTRQELTSSPSNRTEQEPHSPSPQPSLVPVRYRCSRSRSSRRVMGGASTVIWLPLRVKVMVLIRDSNSERQISLLRYDVVLLKTGP